MEHFVRIVFEKDESLTESKLDESIFPGNELLETEQGASVYHIPLPRELNEEEADGYADRLSAYMFEQGLEDFDIEISTDQDEPISEVTYDDDDDFFMEYGVMWYNDDDNPIDEAEYQGRKVKLGKPMAGDVKKFKVYVKNPKGNVVKVNFGQKGVKIKKSNPKRRRSFRARHNCDNPGPRHKARYWSCRKW
jgi:hypothetical protein